MNLHNPPAGTIRASLRHPAFRWLLGGLAVSQIGDWLYNLALVTMVYAGTHSTMWAGVTTAARVVPLVVLGPFGGVIADRFDRRRVMVCCDAIRLVLMLVLALVASLHLPVLLAPVIAAAATASGTPYLPCVSASTPRGPDADLPGANAARSAVTGLGIIAGPALVAACCWSGPRLGLCREHGHLRPVRPGRAGHPGRVGLPPRAPEEQPTSLLRGMAQGMAVLRAYPRALRLVGADIMCSLLSAHHRIRRVCAPWWLALPRSLAMACCVCLLPGLARRAGSGHSCGGHGRRGAGAGHAARPRFPPGPATGDQPPSWSRSLATVTLSTYPG